MTATKDPPAVWSPLISRQTVLATYRTVLALLVVIALSYQYGLTRPSIPLNFFSYFTNLSNLFAAIMLAASAFQLLRNKEPSPSTDLVRGMSVVNMTVVGIVFAVLLRDVDLGSLLPWVNFVLHYVMPLVVVLDWLLLPPSTKFTMRQGLLCLLFPLLYLAYVIVRGASVNWYPYPFLNPANVGGYGGVALYVAGITVVFLLSTWLLLALGNRLGARAALKRP